MIKNTYRYVEYLDDGHERYQCLECCSFIPAVGNYCLNCGCRHTTKLDCRTKDTPRHEHERPELFRAYRPDKPQPLLWTVQHSNWNTFTTAKSALSYLRSQYELYQECKTICYGNARYTYRPTQQQIDFHTQQEEQKRQKVLAYLNGDTEDERTI